jgi:hypothetical protein
MDTEKNEHKKRIKEILLLLELKYLKELKKYVDMGGKIKNKENKKRKKKKRRKRKNKNYEKSDNSESDMETQSTSNEPINKTYSKIKKVFKDSIKSEKSQSIILNDPSKNSCFYFGSQNPREDELIYDKCMRFLGENQPFYLRDTNELKFEINDLVRIFFRISDQINPDNKFLSWEEKKKFILERMMGYWYVVDDREMDFWNLSFMKNVACAANRKEMSVLVHDFNGYYNSGNDINAIFMKYGYETKDGNHYGLQYSFDNLTTQILCDINDLVDMDNCNQCRKIHFLCDKIIDLVMNNMKTFHGYFLEIFVYYVIKYFYNKEELNKYKLMETQMFEEITKLKKIGELCKFVIGFCFRNVIHFGNKIQSFKNLETLIPLVRKQNLKINKRLTDHH